MPICNEVVSQHWRSYLVGQTNSALQIGIPELQVLATAQVLVERTGNRAVNPGEVIWHAPWKQKPEKGCYLFDTILNKPWIVRSSGLFELGNLKVLDPKGN